MAPAYVTILRPDVFIFLQVHGAADRKTREIGTVHVSLYR